MNYIPTFPALNVPTLPVLRALGGCGSTLLNKLLGAVPKSFVLSEVNPRSAQLHGYGLNPLAQVINWRPDLAGELTEFEFVELGDRRRFGEFIRKLYELLSLRGESLVVRDYSYVDYIGTPYLDPAPGDSSLRDALGRHFTLSEVLLVRHPVDQFTSLLRHSHVKNVLTPRIFLKAYEAFLADHAMPVVVRYEDIVRDTLGELQRLCDRWNITFDGDVLPAFGSVPATGFTGSQETITSPIRTERHFDLADDFRKEARYWHLIDVLGYEDVKKPKLSRHLTKSIGTFMRKRIPEGAVNQVSHVA
jgi:hypothetical protein